ncbi:riboflavin synthase [Parvularcula lutaonensis]|uniref:Riboflavin synthase n=1 Tax=Parvularcula lutaonensis TaxID=491923 RepID=A0ABV7M9B3_9PROT|nr:riboflavin synthase [Parvularcula lutaonensis]GGY44901.1 riboflavin synthase subunit alpha [Parvularcula lutaonensis]
MFTGLIEEIGTVVALTDTGKGVDLTVRGPLCASDAKLGDSIAVQGVCLTITDFDDENMTFGLAPETLRRTSLGALEEGDGVNLERACLPTTRLGGHYVQGHVDGTGRLREIREDGDALWVTIDTPAELLKYVVEKAYVAIDGTSLTVTAVDDTSFSVMLVRHTQPLITLPTKQPGQPVNLEVDIMAKFAEKIIKEHMQ